MDRVCLIGGAELNVDVVVLPRRRHDSVTVDPRLLGQLFEQHERNLAASTAGFHLNSFASMLCLASMSWNVGRLMSSVRAARLIFPRLRTKALTRSRRSL